MNTQNSAAPGDIDLFGVERGHFLALGSVKVQYDVAPNVLALKANVPPAVAKTVIAVNIIVTFFIASGAFKIQKAKLSIH